MTREEAAKICQSIKFMMDKDDYSEEVEEALNMAIAALKQLSLPKIIIRQGEQEPCDKRTETHACDLISRQAAIDVLNKMKIYRPLDSDRYVISDCLNKIVNLPSAQPFTSEQIQTMQELESAQIEKAYELGKADRPTGHWIENAQEYYEMINEKGGGVDENTPYFIDDIACSECLVKFSVIDNETERFDFCPKCGSYNGGDTDGSD